MAGFSVAFAFGKADAGRAAALLRRPENHAMTDRPDFVLLATEDQDLGLVAASVARVQAQQRADELGTTVWLRDPASDEPIGHCVPTTSDPETLADLQHHYATMRGD